MDQLEVARSQPFGHLATDLVNNAIEVLLCGDHPGNLGGFVDAPDIVVERLVEAFEDFGVLMHELLEFFDGEARNESS